MSKRRQWNEENMQRALEFYKSESSAGRKISIRQVAEEFLVPKSSLGDRITGRVSSDPATRPGPAPTLSLQGEQKLVDYIKVCAQIGFGRTKQQLLSIVGEIVKEGGIQNRFVSGRPGNDWWLSFIKRWPEVRLCTPQSLPRDRAVSLNPYVVKNYFAMLGEILEKYDLKGKPERIFNADETGMPLDHKPPKIIKVAGQDAHSQTSGNKTNITVVACASASGLLIPPQVIFQGKRGMDQTMFQGMPPGTRVCISPNGWIDSMLFETWVTEHFLKHIPAARPVLLLIDGHSTHVRLEVVRKCKENGIILFALPPHTTHKLQPLDRGCFKPLKEHYKRECKEFMEKNPGRVVSRFVFGKLFGAIYAKSLCPSTIINAFAKCGVFPFSPKVILESDDMAPSLIGNTEIKISSVSDVSKALNVMGVFDSSDIKSSTTPSIPEPSAATIPERPAATIHEPHAATIPEPHAASIPERPAAFIPEPHTASVPEPPAASIPEPHTSSIPEPPAASIPEPHASIPEPPAASIPEPPAASISDTSFTTICAEVHDHPPSDNSIIVPSSTPVSPEPISCPDISVHSCTSPEIPPVVRQPLGVCAVDVVLNNSISDMLDKSKEAAATKKRKVIVSARALTEDEWIEKAEEQERKRKKEEEEKENRKQAREDKKREKEVEKKRKEEERKIKECEKKKRIEARRNKKKPRRRREVTLEGDSDAECCHCGGSYSEDNMEGVGRLWVKCDTCQEWMHGDECLPIGFAVQEGEAFECPSCKP